MLFKSKAKFWAHVQACEVVVADANVVCVLKLQLVFSFRLQTNHKNIDVLLNAAGVLGEVVNEIALAQVVQPYKLGFARYKVFYGEIVYWKECATTCFLLDLALCHKLSKQTREAFECARKSNVWIYFNSVAFLGSKEYLQLAILVEWGVQ